MYIPSCECLLDLSCRLSTNLLFYFVLKFYYEYEVLPNNFLIA